MIDLEGVLHHVVGQAANVRVALVEGAAVTVLWLMDANDEAGVAPHDNDPLGGLALVLASSLQERHAAVLVVDLAARVGVAGAGNGEARGGDRVERGAAEEVGQLCGLVGLHIVLGRVRPEGAVQADNCGVLGAQRKLA